MRTTRPVFPVPASTFSTERLLIRPISSSDVDDIFIIRTQPEVMKWTSSKVPDNDIEKTLEWVGKGLALNTHSTHRMNFSIEEKANPGTVVGAIGCHNMDQEPECGYMFRKEMWGKGYATEALRAFLSMYWALERMPFTDDSPEDKQGADSKSDEKPEVFLAETEVANTASRKVLRKCGFEELRFYEDDGVQLVSYILHRPSSTSP